MTTAWKSLSQRRLQPEWMDDPDLDAARHVAALRGLARINALSFSAAAVWRPIRRLARRMNTDRLRVLDVATGSGDIPLALWRRGQRSGLRLDVLGVDISPRAIEQARQRTERHAAGLQFQTLDVLGERLPDGFDVVVSSLFLHHLPTGDVVGVLRAMSEATEHLVVVNDLVRGRLNLLLVTVAAHLLSRSPVVHVDAPLSIRAAFSRAEILQLAAQAGMADARYHHRWPCRFLLTWQKRP